MKRLEIMIFTIIAGGLLSAFIVLSGNLNANDQAAGDFPRMQLEFDEVSLDVAIADTQARKALGYQHVEPIEAPGAIYFPYMKPVSPRFHMANVKFPLVIHWIGENGCVISKEVIFPGQTGIEPPAPVAGVLEVKGNLSPVEKGYCLKTPSHDG